MTWAPPPDMPPHIARLFEILSLIVHAPGIEFEALRTSLRSPCAVSTLHKDLKILKNMDLLDDRRHREGYYVSATSFSEEETHHLLQALRTTAKNLRHPQARALFEKLGKRLGPVAAEDGTWGYPMMTLGDRVIVDTLDEDHGDFVSFLADAMLRGLAVMVQTKASPWGTAPALVPVYPLQFRFHQVAWYLLAERFDGTIATMRLDRLEPQMREADLPRRGLAKQLQAIARVRRLMRHGWGVRVPPDDRDLVAVTVRFLPDKAGFITEGVRRHPTQEVAPQPDGSILYRVTLHEKALQPFADWILGFGDQVEVMEPATFRQSVIERIRGFTGLYPEMQSDAPTAE